MCFAFFCLTALILLLVAGDVHSNPGPEKDRQTKSLSLLSVNATSIAVPGKIAELADLSHCHNVDIVGVTETWLDDSVASTDFDMDGFQEPERLDRNRHGGGVMVYIANHLVYHRRRDLESNDVEIIWLEILLQNKKLYLGTAYRSPSQSSVTLVDNFFDRLGDMVSAIKQISPTSTVIIQGDLNCPSNEWFQESTTPTRYPGNRLAQFVDSYGLSQMVNSATYVTDAGTRSQLDVFIMDAPGLCLSCDTLPHILECAHLPVLAELSFRVVHDKPYMRTVYDYDITDWPLLNRLLLDADFDECYIHADPKLVCSSWLTLFQSILFSNLQTRSIKVRPKNKPWFSKEARLAVRSKVRSYKRYKRSPTPNNWSSYKSARNRCVQICRDAKATYEENLISRLSDPNITSKKFWALTKSLYGDKRIIPIPSLEHMGHPVSDNAQKAEIFNAFFTSHSVLPEPLPPLPPFAFRTHSRLSSIEVDSITVLRILKALKVSSATGPDGIGNRILKEISVGIHRHLSTFFQYCLDNAYFPKEWKVANVCPVFKASLRSKKENYRPISLLCNISKVFERVVHLHMSSYLKDNNLLYSGQSAYSKGDSTVNQLLKITHVLHEAFEEGVETRGVFLDISKAFDCTWHAGLLYKLQQLGVTDTLLNWVRSYLSDRSQRVIVKGQESTVTKTECGVPQGSILGPLFFLVYMNDLPEVTLSTTYLYADDVALFETVQDPVVSAISLNSDLRQIAQWSNQWLLNFNPGKSRSVLFTPYSANQHQHPPLFLHQSKITEKTAHRHLGLTLSSDLSWSTHIDNVCRAARNKIGGIRHIAHMVPRTTLTTLYCSMVRPAMEYGCIVWGRCTSNNISKLEVVQNEAARLCAGAIKGTNTEKLLCELGWSSLETRRKYLTCLAFHKIYHGRAPNYLLELAPVLHPANPAYSFRSRPMLVMDSSRLHSQRFNYSFFPSALHYWNSLPEEVVNCVTIGSFKRALASFILCPKAPPYFSLPNPGAKFHTQLRLDMSGLNFHLHKIQVVDSPSCKCGFPRETTIHFMLDCPSYARIREELLRGVSRVTELPPRRNDTLHLLLFGDTQKSYDTNVAIFKLTQSYIQQTKRFG